MRYKGRGEHSVNELENLLEYFKGDSEITRAELASVRGERDELRVRLTRQEETILIQYKELDQLKADLATYRTLAEGNGDYARLGNEMIKKQDEEIAQLKAEVERLKGECKFWKADAERTGQLWAESAGSLEKFTHEKEEERDQLRASLKECFKALLDCIDNSIFIYHAESDTIKTRDNLLKAWPWLGEA